MFRMWCKLWKNNHLLADTTIEDVSDLNRTRKIFAALEVACHQFDLPVPIWLNSNIDEFKKTSKTRFRDDSFIEKIPFDYLEIQVIEEDI
ncbi:MAG: hypothetical protein J5757_01935 [Lachnospiraceae bacterium]|nr:hypothetical protein [Lachnospiraceae bacterium]